MSVGGKSLGVLCIILCIFQFPNVINLSVGGKKFATRLTTLRKYPDSMLAVMFSGRHAVDTDQDNNYFIDRYHVAFINLE